MIAFARLTELHDMLTRSLTPCAERLYRYLLRKTKAGVVQEFEIPDFAEEMSYSTRHTKRALIQLEKAELVTIVRKYSSTVFKLIAWHPDQDKTLPSPPQKPKKHIEVSKKEASKPDSTVPIYRDNRELQTAPPTPHPVENDEGEDSGCEAKLPETDLATRDEVNPETRSLLQEIKDNGIFLNSTLQRLVIKAGTTIVRNALAALQEQTKQGRVKNPSGFLVRAIQNGWKPNQHQHKPIEPAKPVEVRKAPKEFLDWYELARKLNVVQASEMQHGEIYVHTHEGWEAWGYFRKVFPMDLLERMVSWSTVSG